MKDCSVCGKVSDVVYPLLAGNPAFCSTHHNPMDAGPFGADFTGPDDFDIPFCGEDIPFYSSLNILTKKKFVWTDKDGNKHKLADIDNYYLKNIINFLKRKNNDVFEELINFLENELRHRRSQSNEVLM